VCENVKKLPYNNQNFTDHIWIREENNNNNTIGGSGSSSSSSGKIALSNDKGEIFLIYENEVK
jgi:hypothetical protein